MRTSFEVDVGRDDSTQPYTARLATAPDWLSATGKTKRSAAKALNAAIERHVWAVEALMRNMAGLEPRRKRRDS